MKAGLGGKIVEAGEAVISVYDHGFLYGLGLFETFRTYGGRPYLLERHLNRLSGGCAELGIRFGMSIQEIEEWVGGLLRENGLKDGYVRLTVSAGEAALGLPTGDYEQPNTVLLVKELPPASDAALMRGKELRLLQTRRNTPEGSVRFKSLHYMNNIIARRELLGLAAAPAEGGSGQASADAASSSKCDSVDETGQRPRSQAASSGLSSSPPLQSANPGAEGLMLSEAGWLAEGIVSNLFFVRSGVVCTPAVGTGILPGVTRQRVLELATDAGYKTEEGFYRFEELREADEIWMTNSIQELVPVTKLTDTNGVSVVVGAKAGAVGTAGAADATDIAGAVGTAGAGGAGGARDGAGVAGPITIELLQLYRKDAVH